jgi:hypothetical protein
MGRLRIYSELVPLRELVRAPVLSELARREIQLLAAVSPHEVDDARRLVDRARTIGLSIGLWPLLPDERGRWIHPGNASEIRALIDRLLPLAADAMVLDLEPPIDEVRRVSRGDLRAARPWLSRALDARVHREIVGVLRERAIESVAAVAPQLVLPGASGRGWQRALGTPLIDYDTITAMTYTTLFEGYSAGMIGRADARALLARFAQRPGGSETRPYGDGTPMRHALSLGCVGVGALGDEATYRDPSELADDVAIARACGVDDLALFDLSGVLARPPIDRWLDALNAKPSAIPEPTPRARMFAGGMWLTGVALDLVARRR